jgi:hypothetical protein
VEELEIRALPSVLTPAQVRHAYAVDQVQFTVNGKSVVGDGSGQTIAIVVADDDPNIAADVNSFDQSFVVNSGSWRTLYQQYGSSSQFLTVAKPEGQPTTDSTGTWELETSLDVEWAHAIAPGAKILLVEAASDTFSNLINAVSYAAKQPGVSVVSMSWGDGEFSGESAYDSVFTTPPGHNGVTFVAASGDTGAPGNWPAASPNVVDVGGTSLTVDSVGDYEGESAWSGGGGGVSSQEPRPSYQATVEPTLKNRATPDVSANANPNTAGYVYDSFPVNGRVWDWWQWGGTSAAAPQWAALIAIADQGRALAGKGTLDGATQTLPALYQLPSTDFHDITTGSNGDAAHAGYDLATGLGSPIANRLIPGLVAYSGVAGRPSGAATSIPPTGLGLTAKQSLLFQPVAGPETPTPPMTTPDSAPAFFVWVGNPSGPPAPAIPATVGETTGTFVPYAATVVSTPRAESARDAGGTEGAGAGSPAEITAPSSPAAEEAAPSLPPTEESEANQEGFPTDARAGAQEWSASRLPVSPEGAEFHRARGAAFIGSSSPLTALTLGAFWGAIAGRRKKQDGSPRNTEPVSDDDQLMEEADRL